VIFQKRPRSSTAFFYSFSPSQGKTVMKDDFKITSSVEVGVFYACSVLLKDFFSLRE
jgi:hypothetical protein